MTRAKANATEVVPVQETAVGIRTPEVIASEIRIIDNQARQYVLQSAIEIGRKLTEAKSLVEHGEWGNWLKEHVNYSQSTAQNFMRVADEYKADGPLVNLSYSQAVALLSVPAEERETFVEEHNASEMSTRELQQAIKDKRELEEKLSQQKEDFDKWAADHAEKRDALYQQYQVELELRKSQEVKLRELEAEIEKAKESGDGKEAAKLKAELRKAEKQIGTTSGKVGELEEALKAKDAEIAKAVEEGVQKAKQELEDNAQLEKQAMQEQINKLNQQLSRANNESFLKAKLCIETIVKDGDALVKAIAAVQEADEQTKLKTAALTVIDKLKSLL